MKAIKIVSLTMIFLTATVFLGGCKKEEEQKNKDLYILDVSQDTSWDYWVVANAGGYYLINQENEMPTVVFFKPDQEQAGYPIYFNENGMPVRAVIQDHIFLFGNFRGNLMDISVVYPDGQIGIFRDIEGDVNWDELPAALKSAADAEAWSDVVRWTGLAVSGVSCGLSVAAAVGTGGIAIPLAVLGCGATVTSLVLEFVPEDYELLGLSATTIGAFAGVVGCIESAGVACALDIAAMGMEITSAGLEDIEQRQEDVRMAESLLFTGSGDIKFTLTWNTATDIDLHVIDPIGEEIWWSHTYSASGGILDYDDIDGYGPENIYWPDTEAPAGTYQVYLHYYSGEPVTSYTVLVVVNDEITKYTGSISYDQYIHITDVDLGGLKSLIKAVSFKPTLKK